MTRALLRLLVWLADSLPLYSWRRCCREWEAGRVFERQQLGITRGPHGLFVSAKHPTSRPAMVAVPSANENRGETKPSESSGRETLFT
jgi:hypothetical protein